VLTIGLAGAPLAAEAGSFTGLGDLPGGSDSWASGVSADGSVVVGFGTDADGEKAFIWDPEHGMRDLFTVLVTEQGLGGALTGWTLLEATAISADGRTIVGYGFNPAGQVEPWRVQLTPVPLPAAWLVMGSGLAAVGWLRSRLGC
jgi:probable HAF family extracellular repeat protein